MRTSGLLRLIAVLGVVSSVMTGCAIQRPAGETVVVQPAAAPSMETLLDVGGVERSVVVRDPEGAASGLVPALVMLHGATGSGSHMELVSGMTPIAAANGFVVAYPNGTAVGPNAGGLAWNAGTCCGRPVQAAVQDVAFLEAVIANLVDHHRVDPARVYLAGFSNGGMLAYRYMCDSAMGVAGIAVVGGALNVTSCAAPRPVSLLVIHGEADPTVPYDGGLPSATAIEKLGRWVNASVADATDFWSTRDSCSGHSVVASGGASAGVERVEYTGCIAGSGVTIISLANTTHHWPTVTRGDIDATREIAIHFGLVR